MAHDYPRDLTGYGRNPPDPRWPDGAAIAVQFVVNYEEGGENCILHGDPASEAFLSEIVGAQAWPGQRHMNMESIYEFGARAGFWRLWRLFTQHQVPVTVFGVATALERSPEQVAAMTEANWEIASHGLKWIDYKDFTKDAERDHLREALRIHEEVTGSAPLGWYCGRTSEHTLDLIAEAGSLLYSADSYADELPYWVKNSDRHQLMVPYTLDANDMRFATPQGFNSGAQFYDYLQDSFDQLYEEGLAGAPKMMSIGLHCRLAGRPGRFLALRRFLEYVLSHERVWLARRVDIARHWLAHHAPASLRPSTMTKTQFVASFGGVYEHSPWIAEASFEAGLSAAEDSAEGLHRKLAESLRQADEQRKLALIKAHPDLAGRLAEAKRLTADSTKEQAGAGLDNLTDEERARFMELNDAYVGRFGFPFVMAVKGRGKAEILEAFEQRLNHPPETEFETALGQIEKIALLRLQEKLPE